MRRWVKTKYFLEQIIPKVTRRQARAETAATEELRMVTALYFSVS